MHRWQKVLQPGLKKGKWSAEEDQILFNWVKSNGANRWSKLSYALQGRSSKQIRDRWINNLNPQRAKDFTWTDKLDQILLIKYIEFGSSWVYISKFIPNSTENMIKNRFYSMLRSIATKKNKISKNNKKADCKTINDTYEMKDEDFFSLKNYESKSGNFVNKNIKKKRNNFSLSFIINYLPDLLKEKEIDLNKIKVFNEKDILNENLSVNNRNYSNGEIIYGNCNFLQNSFGLSQNYAPSQISFNDDQKKILGNFFSTLSGKFPQTQTDINPTVTGYNKNEGSSLDENKNKAQFKFKSTILLNLQLHLLQRIFQRCKLQIVSRFFNCFKGNAMTTPII